MTYGTESYPPESPAGATAAGAGSPGGFAGESGAGSGGGKASATRDAAKEQASQVSQTAAARGSQVAGTAGEQARQVATEAQTQARDLVGEARGQVQQRASQQKQVAASQVRSLADELRGMATGQGGGSGVVTQLASQGADRVQGLADWLEQREPAELIEELRQFARRRPGAFLLGAALAGVAAGRLTKGAVAATQDNGSDNLPATTGTYGDTGTSYAGTAGTAYTGTTYSDSYTTGVGAATAAGTVGGTTPTGTAGAPLVEGGPTAAGEEYTHGREAVGERLPSTGPLADDPTTGYDLGGGPAEGYGSQGPVR